MPSNAFVIFNFSLIAPIFNHFSENVSDSKLQDGLINKKFVLRTNFDEFEFPVNFLLTSKLFIGVPQTISFINCFIGTIHSKKIKVNKRKC